MILNNEVQFDKYENDFFMKGKTQTFLARDRLEITSKLFKNLENVKNGIQ
jgi:hypothetical protein